MHSWWGGTMYSTVNGGELVKTMHLYQVLTSQSWHDRYSIKTQGWVDQTVFLWFTSVLWVVSTLRCSGTVDRAHKGICSVQSCSNYLQTSPGHPGKPAETPDDKVLVKTDTRKKYTHIKGNRLLWGKCVRIWKIFPWLIERVSFTSHSTQNRSFRRCSS